MARLRDYALVGGFALSFGGGVLLSLRPESVEFGMMILVPGLLLFLWGLLSAPKKGEDAI